VFKKPKISSTNSEVFKNEVVKNRLLYLGQLPKRRNLQVLVSQQTDELAAKSLFGLKQMITIQSLLIVFP